MYPSSEKIVEYTTKMTENQHTIQEVPTPDSNITTTQIEQLKLLADRDPLHELHEQERKMIWALRHHCITKIPTLLAKLLQCVEWNDHRYQFLQFSNFHYFFIMLARNSRKEYKNYASKKYFDVSVDPKLSFEN